MNNQLNISYTKFSLSNGIKCIIYPRNEIHSVSIQVNVNVGSLDENKITNGFAHFLEHVVHNGTEALPTWDAVDEYVNNYSGSTNAFTNISFTQYYGVFPSQFYDEALFYFSQIVLHPLLEQKEIDKERTIILDEMRGYEDEIDYKIMQNIKEKRFTVTDSSHSFEIIGTKDSVTNATRSNLLDFYKKYYTSDNIEIYIVGNVDIEDTRKSLEKHFETISRQPAPNRAFKKSFPTYSTFNIAAQQKLDLDQYYLTFTYPSLSFNQATIEERHMLGFLSKITASGSFFQSVLWKRLRQELAIVYGVFSWNYDMFSRSIFGIQTSFNKEHLPVVLEEMYKGIQDILDNKITSIVFDAYKKKIMDTQLMQMDKPENVISWITDFEDELTENGRGMSLAEYLEFVKGVQFEQILELAKKVYSWENLNIGLVTSDPAIEVEKNVTELWDKIASQTRMKV